MTTTTRENLEASSLIRRPFRSFGSEPVTRKGIAYFPTFEDARDFGSRVGRGFPAWRVVAYELGWAVQTRPSGAYFGPDGKPT